MITNEEILKHWSDTEMTPDFKPVLDEVLKERSELRQQLEWATRTVMTLLGNKQNGKWVLANDIREQHQFVDQMPPVYTYHLYKTAQGHNIFKENVDTEELYTWPVGGTKWLLHLTSRIGIRVFSSTDVNKFNAALYNANLGVTVTE